MVDGFSLRNITSWWLFSNFFKKYSESSSLMTFLQEKLIFDKFSIEKKNFIVEDVSIRKVLVDDVYIK